MPNCNLKQKSHLEERGWANFTAFNIFILCLFQGRSCPGIVLTMIVSEHQELFLKRLRVSLTPLSATDCAYRASYEVSDLQH
jgi:hypothetical protein